LIKNKILNFIADYYNVTFTACAGLPDTHEKTEGIFMNEKDCAEMDMMVARFGFSLTEEEIGKILNGIRKKVSDKYFRQ